MQWEPLVGAFIGSSIPASLSFLGLRANLRSARSERQQLDASIVGPTLRLLRDTHPDRVALNARAELDEEKWKQLGGRSHRVQEDLLTLSVAHGDEEVRRLAKQLSTEVSNAVVQSRHLVSDVLQHRDLVDQRALALKDHDRATQTAESLAQAVVRAGRGR